jgi:3-oxoacyl-[acyl-carrier protein] reductase
MAGDLDGKTALVTGASRGIGREIAIRLAARGAFVVVHYGKGRTEAQAVVDEIVASGGQAAMIGADLGSTRGVEALVESLKSLLVARAGAASLDILVNNAGVGERAPIENVTEADFDRALQLNLKAPFFLIQKTIPMLRDGARIINVSSMSTRVAYPALATYAPSKAGLEALTLLLAAHLGPRGITVNAVLPGATATDMHPATKDPAAAAALAQTVALRRMGQPGDVAEVIVWLASDAARWVTGQRIEASGGQRI